MIPEVIADWNAVHSMSNAAVIEPVLWETHSRPDLAGRPQEVINEQLVANCDLLIGAFWTRLGTPTGEALSGTAEEIEHFREAGKPVLLYFSGAPVVPESLDSAQYAALTEYRKSLEDQGLYFRYESLAEFRALLQRHIAGHMIDLVKAAGGNPLSLEKVNAAEDAQVTALSQFLANYDAFLRRTGTEWSAERDSDPHSTDDAKYILARAADEVVHFLSMITNDSCGISDKLADCLRRLKALQRHEVFIDGGVSWREFWTEGDAILGDLGAARELLASAAE
ncbi:MAG: hypothetical protein JNM76_18345 [Betaproteobacteria bacterium]|nr:hypothetical protein [Betaproteobacteria bacterium]